MIVREREHRKLKEEAVDRTIGEPVLGKEVTCSKAAYRMNNNESG